MKKKLLSLVLALIMVISLVPTSFAAAGLGNFKKTNTYTPGMFRDVFSSDWYATNVIAAYQFGLVKGTTATNFNPKGNITVAETIALACRLHSIYNTGAANFTQGNPWYQVYVDYALSKGIIKGAYSNYNAKISRADFAFILNNSLPAEALKGINNVPANTLADVANDNRAGAIYNLYRAGILTGNDKYGTFNPNSNIQRSEVATIVTRMADQTQRKTFTLETKPVVPQSVTLAGKTTILAGETTQWKATISPAGANQWVSWNSGNPGVATVDANGNIKAIKEGQSNITATASNGVKKTVLLTVQTLKPQSVTLAGKTTIHAGETTQWKATISPAGANQWVSWNSGNPGVATVDANGNIKAIKAGQSNITATASNGVKKTVLLTVLKGPDGTLANPFLAMNSNTIDYYTYAGTRKIIFNVTGYARGELAEAIGGLKNAENGQEWILLKVKVNYLQGESELGSFYVYNNLYNKTGSKYSVYDNEYRFGYSCKEGDVYNKGIGNFSTFAGGSMEGYVAVLTDAGAQMPLVKLSVEGGNVFVSSEGAPELKKKTKEEKIAEDPVLSKCKLQLPAVPTTLSNLKTTYTSSGNKDILQSKFDVTEITYEFKEGSGGKVNLHIYYKGQKTYDVNGAGQSADCKIGWKLYDSEGYVVKDGTTYTLGLAMNEKFKDVEETIYSLEPGVYKLVIVGVNGY